MQPYSKKVPTWAKIANVNLGGAGSSDIICCHSLEKSAYGNGDNNISIYPLTWGQNAGLIAGSYLWRRFGPSPSGYDDYKSLCEYVISTPMKGIYLAIYPGANHIGMGYRITKELEELARKPERDFWNKFNKFAAKNSNYTNLWEAYDDKELVKKAKLGKFPRTPVHEFEGWKKGTPVIKAMNKALLICMKEMLRPVYIRDCYFNVLGSCKPTEGYETAEYHPLTGYGVPVEEMQKLIKKDK